MVTDNKQKPNSDTAQYYPIRLRQHIRSSQHNLGHGLYAINAVQNPRTQLAKYEIQTQTTRVIYSRFKNLSFCIQASLDLLKVLYLVLRKNETLLAKFILQKTFNKYK